MAPSNTRSRTCIAAALLWIASSATAAEFDVNTILGRVGVTDGTRVDIAVFTRDNSCYESSGGLRFHAASITKLFTATVIMQLRDEGQLSLRDPVSKFVPEFSGSPILIEQLLTHTSGLRDKKRANGRTTRAQWDTYIHDLSTQRLAIPQWSYADAGFNLLGRVIENITGKAYALVVTERLLAPLGMSDSVFDPAKVPAEQLVRAADKRGRELTHPWDLAFLPSSGLQSNASDLAKFGRQLLAVDAEKLREVTTTRAVTEWPGVSQGYGWQLMNSGSAVAIRHAGGEAGFESLLTLYPAEGFGVVVMGNRKDWPRFELASSLASEVRAGHLCK